MQLKKIGLFAVMLAFVVTSVAFAGGKLVWTDEHSDVYAATATWGDVADPGYFDRKPLVDKEVRSYYGPDISSEPGRPLGFPLDRHPQLDVWVPPAGHPPYGP
jgi:hypothetical protein